MILAFIIYYSLNFYISLLEYKRRIKNTTLSESCSKFELNTNLGDADTLKKTYVLCELYFSKTDTSNTKNKKEDFISVRNYNIVFEDMIDKLFSDICDFHIKTLL